jgi:hypothetical protein
MTVDAVQAALREWDRGLSQRYRIERHLKFATVKLYRKGRIVGEARGESEREAAAAALAKVRGAK